MDQTTIRRISHAEGLGIEVRGPLHMSACRALWHYLRRICDDRPRPHVRLNLRAADGLEPSGADLLAGLAGMFQARGGSLSLADVSEAVRELLESAGWGRSMATTSPSVLW